MPFISIESTMTSMKTNPEQLLSWTAIEDLRFIRYTHSTLRMAIQLVASNPDLAALLEAQLKLNAGFVQNATKASSSNAADRAIEVARNLVESDFQVLRRSGLIGLCASLEHLVKCIIVEWSELAPQKVHGLEHLKISLQASDFLEADQRDRFFLIADKIYQEAQSSRGHADKIRNIMRTNLPDQYDIFKSEASAINELDLNEAFLVRNCLVHHGAKVNRPLAKLDGFELGAPITITAKSLGRYFEAIDQMGSSLFSCAASYL